MSALSKRTPVTLAAVAAALWLAIGCWLPAARAAPAAEPVAIATIVEGDAVLMRDTQRLRPAEGTRLLSQDIVETPADAGSVVRIEYPDGVAMNLGPATRVLIDPQFYGERGRFARVYLLAGWIKLRGVSPPEASDSRAIALIASPALDILSAEGSVVLHVTEPAFSTFVERGSATLHERLGAKPSGAPRPLRSGQFLTRGEGAASSLASRPAPTFIQHMPRPFLDTLPDRAALFRERAPAPKPVGPISYADAADWLAVEPTLRRPAIKRWRPLAQDAAFRAALVANMKSHPEWDRILFPEKYLPSR